MFEQKRGNQSSQFGFYITTSIVYNSPQKLFKLLTLSRKSGFTAVDGSLLISLEKS